MKDLTSFLTVALAHAERSWSKASSVAVLNSIAGASAGGTVDWDEAAGERWGRVIMQGRPAAMVAMDAPVVFLTLDLDAAASRARELGAHVLVIGGMDHCDFRVDRRLLESWTRGTLPDAFDPDQFSIQALWWATV